MAGMWLLLLGLRYALTDEHFSAEDPKDIIDIFDIMEELFIENVEQKPVHYDATQTLGSDTRDPSLQTQKTVDEGIYITTETSVLKIRESEPTEFVLMSTGAASSYQGSALGVYTLLPGSPPAYHQKGGDYYLYQDKDTWYLSPRISGCDKTYTLGCAATWTASIKTKDIHSVGSVWSYGKDKEWANDDPTIHFVPITSMSAACIRCSAVDLISTGPAQESKPEYFGVFYAVPGLFSAGRPVYQNHAGLYLMVKNEYTTFSVWDDVERTVSAGKGEEGIRSLRSGSAPTCVSGMQGQVGRMGHGWQVREEQKWVRDDTISARCL